MNDRIVKNVAASVKNRLLNIARQNHKPFEEVLVLYGLERFLYRLSISPYKEKFVLKGGLLLIGFGFPQARPTKDIDFLGLMNLDIGTASEYIQKIANIDIDDGLQFDLSNLAHEEMTPTSEYPGFRFKFSSQLGQARIPIQIDIGFGDSMVPDPNEMEFPTILEMDPPIILSYSPETIIAEKFEAALDLADINSRMKDFYDIWVLSQSHVFDGQTLKEAIFATCKCRNTPLHPNAEVFSDEFFKKQDKQKQWSAFIKKGPFSNAPKAFSILMEDIKAFLLPIALKKYDDQFNKSWPSTGPWQDM
ncbi:MAG: nucleotidyl transferase AbiEii/AbiGii toxin family protein [Desulfobacterales bacterium]|nr:nucleotidyl transferase AbiEii/AbiGii toxin family protein [Desulfobacterales bacterium]